MSNAEDFTQHLDTMVLLLQAANETPEMADPALLAEMLGGLQSSAAASGTMPGVPELLRSWRMALQDLLRSGGGFEGSELVLMAMWFMSLQEHVSGRLDQEGQTMLARLPEGIRWLPCPSPAFAQGIARRLHATSAALPAVQATAAMPAAGSAGTATMAADIAQHAMTGSNTGIDADATGDVAVVMPQPVAVADDVAADEMPEASAFSDFDVLPDLVPSDESAFATVEAMPAASLPEAALESESESGFNSDSNSVPNAGYGSEYEREIEASPALETDTVLESAFAVPSPSSADAQADADVFVFDVGLDTPMAGTTEDPRADVGPMAGTAVAMGDDHADALDDTDAAAGDDLAFALDTWPGDAPGAPPADAADVVDAVDGPIWIGQDELDLTRQAIAEQLLPMAQAWADTTDADTAASLTGELGYQMQLVGNVLELIGTQALARGMSCLRDGVERGDPATGPETVATWCSVLLAVIEAPGEESAELLILAADGLPGLDAAWADALRDELARVSIGFDPALIAARKTLAEPDDMTLAPADDVVPSVLEGMLGELPGNATRLGASVRSLADERSFGAIDEARRVAHTIKGDANTVGVHGLAHLTHALEDILVALAKRPEQLDDDLADLLVDAGDCVEEMADHLLGRGPAPERSLALYQQVLDAANALAEGGSAPAAPGPSAQAGIDAPAASDTPSAPPAAAAAEVAPRTTAGQTLNVSSALLDELQRLAGEGMVTSRQIDRQLDGLNGLHREQRSGVRNHQDLLARLDDLVALRGAALQSAAQQAGSDIDPLELDQYNELHIISRQLLEAQADSGEFMRRIARTMAALDELRNQQEQLNRELQRTILRTRTVPFEQISARLQRIVRQTSRQVGKPVELDIIGDETPVDAELLERVVEPLAHLLRNAIDHGIEPPQVRQTAGKPPTGQITLRVGLQGDVATIDIQDDGRGLDFAAIRARALDTGLIDSDLFASDDGDAIDERMLTRLILLPGFSTRDSATDVSGRGIGMDVVNQRIAALRGSMQISSEAGRGTRIALRLPVTQTLANVIVARGQLQVSAIVASSVERVVSFSHDECRFAPDSGLQVCIDEAWLPALPIERLYDEHADASGWLTSGGTGLLAADADGQRCVVLVQAVDEVRSVVVKPVSTWLPPIPAVRGITQLGDGGLAPVLDLDQLLQAQSTHSVDPGQLALVRAAPVTRVVVADDSLSVRRALEQLMQDAGFEVATARDGFEALAAVHAKPTHALLVDLEMPRMNGLEVTRSLRNHDETRELPVVMITSRATDRHQAMAAEAGVTRMLGKPFSEDSLVALVRELMAAH